MGKCCEKRSEAPIRPRRRAGAAPTNRKAPPELLNLDGPRGARREPAESCCSGKTERLARGFSRALIKLRAEPAEAAFWSQQRRQAACVGNSTVLPQRSRRTRGYYVNINPSCPAHHVAVRRGGWRCWRRGNGPDRIRPQSNRRPRRAPHDPKQPNPIRSIHRTRVHYTRAPFGVPAWRVGSVCGGRRHLLGVGIQTVSIIK